MRRYSGSTGSAWALRRGRGFALSRLLPGPPLCPALKHPGPGRASPSLRQLARGPELEAEGLELALGGRSRRPSSGPAGVTLPPVHGYYNLPRAPTTASSTGLDPWLLPASIYGQMSFPDSVFPEHLLCVSEPWQAAPGPALVCVARRPVPTSYA